MKKLLLILLILALMLCLCACGEPQSPEDRAQQFLSTLLADDAELQQALLDNVTVIGIGVPAPTEEELAERTEREAAITQMLHDRFDGLASPELIDKNATDGQLTYWQTMLAYCGVKASITDCSFTDDGSCLAFNAEVHCTNGEDERDMPMWGEIYFNDDGLIDSYKLYHDIQGFTGWLWAQDRSGFNERINGPVEQP